MLQIGRKVDATTLSYQGWPPSSSSIQTSPLLFPRLKIASYCANFKAVAVDSGIDMPSLMQASRSALSAFLTIGATLASAKLPTATTLLGKVSTLQSLHNGSLILSRIFLFTGDGLSSPGAANTIGHDMVFGELSLGTCMIAGARGLMPVLVDTTLRDIPSPSSKQKYLHV
jgi:hypothetical protein